MIRIAGCPLCEGDGGVVLARAAKWRLVRAQEAGFPAFYRVIWNEHAPEFSMLSSADRAKCMDAVVRVELLVRRHLKPVKVNVASLGNAVPHLHWHVVARYDWDSHYPGSVWSARLREPDPARIAEVQQACALLETELADWARPG